MSEPQTNLDPPESDSPTAPQRVIADWEYRTAYLQFFQVRMPAELHNRLCEWAREECKTLENLLIETLEEAVRRHAESDGLRA